MVHHGASRQHGTHRHHPLGPTTAPARGDVVPGITVPPGSGHTIYDTFDVEKRVI